MELDLISWITIGALLVNTAALIFVIYQSFLTKKSLEAAKQSIDYSKEQRQLEMLPKFGWIIHVQTELKFWKDDLLKIRAKLQIVLSKNEKIVEDINVSNVKKPKDLYLNKYLYDNMPPWLRELWMAGAQYYFDAMAPLTSNLKPEVKNNYYKIWIDDRGINTINSITELMNYLEEMVPPVILNSPARLSDDDFFEKG